MEGEKQDENEARQGGREASSPSSGRGKREPAQGTGPPLLAGK